MLHEPIRAVGRQGTLLHAVQHGGVSCIGITCCSWGRLRRGLPRPSVTDCRLLTPRGARAEGTLRRDFLSAGFPDR